MVAETTSKDSGQPGNGNGNGHKPRVLVLSQDPRINHLLEYRLALLDYPVTFIDSSEQLDAPESKMHDIFVLCKLPTGTSGMERMKAFSHEMHFLRKLLLDKGERNEPYLAIVPLEREEGGFRFNISENSEPGAFDEPRRTIYRAFASYQRVLENKPANLEQEMLEDIVGSVSREAAAPREQARAFSVDMLLQMVKDKPNQPELHFALGQAYEASNAPLEALMSYKKALELKPGYHQAVDSLGSLLLNPRIAQRMRKPQILELLGIFTQQDSPDIDHYRNALYLAMDDAEWLRKAIEISSRYEDRPQFIDFYPTIIDACSRIAFRSKQPEDSERLYNAIEKFVNTVEKSGHFLDVSAAVGMRLVKKGTGRHVVFDVVPTTREGSMQSQHMFIKAFTPKQRKSAEIELKNILALQNEHKGRLKTLYGEMLLPGFAVLAQKPDDERSKVYLATPLLAGERADRVLEQKSPDLRRAYLLRIMAGGLALQRSLQELGRSADPEQDFYSNRFLEKVVERAAAYGLAKLSTAEANALVGFYRRQVDEPLTQVNRKLKLPYTGSHTLKNINIDENPPRSLEQEIQQSTSPQRGTISEVDRSTLARYDIEDISNRFFVSDHALSIEDSAVGINDPRELKEWYDTLLLQFFATQPSAPKYLTADYIDQCSAQKKALTASKLLRTRGMGLTREEYHDIVSRVALERHLTFTFDRIKEIAQKKEQLRALEARHKPLAAYGKLLHNAIERGQDFNYEGLLNRLMQMRSDQPQQGGWQSTFLYVSLHRDYETYVRSKNNHLARVRARMDQLWGKQGRDSGYRAFKKILDSAASYQ